MEKPHIRFYKPDTKLRPYISAYYFADVPSGEAMHDLMHPEWANIRCTLSGYWTFESAKTSGNSADMPVRLYGPTSRATKVTGFPPTRTASAGILPLGWAHLIGLPAHEYADRIAPLQVAFKTDAARLRQALCEAPDDGALCTTLDDFFLALLATRPGPQSLLLRAHALLLDPAISTVEAFAEGLGRSTRQVARLSLEMFGFPPKLLLRRQRFLRTLANLRSVNGTPWVKLIDNAYYDQSHFVRDFQYFMGMSPSHYFASPRVILDPAALLRRDAIGELLQGLHPVATRNKV